MYLQGLPCLFLSVITKHLHFMPGQYKRTFPYTFLPLCLAATGKELINNITPPLSPGKGSPYYKTRRDHTVTSCEAVQDEAIKAGLFFFFPPNKGHILLEDAEGSQWQ